MGLVTAAQIGDELVICMVLVSAVLPCVELCDICESLQPWVFPQGLDDYLYDRGVYGKGYSSTDPVAFKIPKASEASAHFLNPTPLPRGAFLKVMRVCSRDWTR